MVEEGVRLADERQQLRQKHVRMFRLEGKDVCRSEMPANSPIRHLALVGPALSKERLQPSTDLLENDVPFSRVLQRQTCRFSGSRGSRLKDPLYTGCFGITLGSGWRS